MLYCSLYNIYTLLRKLLYIYNTVQYIYTQTILFRKFCWLILLGSSVLINNFPMLVSRAANLLSLGGEMSGETRWHFLVVKHIETPIFTWICLRYLEKMKNQHLNDGLYSGKIRFNYTPQTNPSFPSLMINGPILDLAGLWSCTWDTCKMLNLAVHPLVLCLGCNYGGCSNSLWDVENGMKSK